MMALEQAREYLEQLGLTEAAAALDNRFDPDEEEVYTLFDSMPELVDYTFGLDFSTAHLRLRYDRETYDRRVKRLMAEFAGLSYDIRPSHVERIPG